MLLHADPEFTNQTNPEFNTNIEGPINTTTKPYYPKVCKLLSYILNVIIMIELIFVCIGCFKYFSTPALEPMNNIMKQQVQDILKTFHIPVPKQEEKSMKISQEAKLIIVSVLSAVCIIGGFICGWFNKKILMILGVVFLVLGAILLIPTILWLKTEEEKIIEEFIGIVKQINVDKTFHGDGLQYIAELIKALYEIFNINSLPELCMHLGGLIPGEKMNNIIQFKDNVQKITKLAADFLSGYDLHVNGINHNTPNTSIEFFLTICKSYCMMKNLSLNIAAKKEATPDPDLSKKNPENKNILNNNINNTNSDNSHHKKQQNQPNAIPKTTTDTDDAKLTEATPDPDLSKKNPENKNILNNNINNTNSDNSHHKKQQNQPNAIPKTTTDTDDAKLTPEKIADDDAKLTPEKIAELRIKAMFSKGKTQQN